MGIEGLLKFLAPIVERKHVSAYRGKKVAIDAYIWYMLVLWRLHRIIKGRCIEEIYSNHSNQLTTKLVNTCICYINQFHRMGVELLMVFDGAKLPIKQGEEEVRERFIIAKRREREESRKQAEDLAEKGQEDAAMKKMRDAYEITAQTAYLLVRELKKQNFPFIVAPYEADAQLAYLSRNGLVDVVLTGDSDLLVFGARVVMFKFDCKDFTGEEIRLDRIKEIKSPSSLVDFSHSMFISACIMNGCDYL